MHFQRLCVFCGSSAGNRPEYSAAAEALGDILVQRGIELVYGGGNIGLMGTLADRVLSRGHCLHLPPLLARFADSAR